MKNRKVMDITLLIFNSVSSRKILFIQLGFSYKGLFIEIIVQDL